ncbi:acyl carrier protein [Oceanomicrobium pacificus]|uniref:Acyl carrier protein AcpXL n=1 Tax=Oceanomicrobium pacificus TaxID=2692916 RepID=A0A6B0TNW8_9RHOB|nr:acyl carrier protein [Oceanomicrobium pacificus]MXU66247.1 acyl carrier protein [Oceanomicrobium pacificus]
MTTSVKDQVVEIIAEQAVLDPRDVAMDATLEDLGIDSLGLVEAVFAIEETFDIQVPFNANDPAQSEFDITNVASMVAAVEKLVAQKAA